jgi:AcrR family transcriptional regulator
MSSAGPAGGAAAGGHAGRRRSRGGRRAGDSGTREAILAAARGQFADFGYYGATIRGIAAVAEVDPALVHHFYGTKEALFSAAMRLPVVPSEVLTSALAPGKRPADGELGEHLVRTALSVWESGELKETFVGLLRSAVTNEQAAVMLREFIADSILGTLARLTGLGDLGNKAEAEYRAAMVATQMIGLALARLVFGFPAVAGASIDELAATIGPAVERYLNGDIAVPGRVSSIGNVGASAESSEL